MKEKTEIIKKWIEKGDHDLGTAMITHKYIPKYKDTIAFHCQQSVEKYLKGYVFYLGLPIRRTHDLIFLIEQIDEKEKITKKWFDAALELQDFAVEIRYTDQIIELSDKDIETAINISKEFRSMVLEKLKIDYDFEYPK